LLPVTSSFGTFIRSSPSFIEVDIDGDKAGKREAVMNFRS